MYLVDTRYTGQIRPHLQKISNLPDGGIFVLPIDGNIEQARKSARRLLTKQGIGDMIRMATTDKNELVFYCRKNNVRYLLTRAMDNVRDDNLAVEIYEFLNGGKNGKHKS